MSKSWFEVSPQGLRKTLSQKDKFFLITETVSNAWDAEGCTRVDITLTKPDEQGFSWLTATDNAPKGFTDISHSYMMYAESEKKDKANKRGRFNAGEKDVIAMSVEARLTTVTGQILFNGDGTRTEGTEKRTEGSELTAKIPLTLEEYEHVIAQAHRLIPPNNIATYVNGQHVASRRAAGVFEDTLPTPLSDREGFVRNVDRACKIKLHNPLPGEQSYIYEMGIPIVELGDDCWHVDVQQKVPLSRDRDNVNPAYLRKVRAAVLNAMVDKLTPEETELGWVEAAAGAPEAKEDTIKTMLGTRFGNREMVLPVTSDPGATREAQSQGAVVLDRALTGDLRKRVKDLKNADGTSFIAPATDKYKTLNKHDVSDEVPEEQWSQSTRDYVAFIERVSPELIDQRVEVRVIDKDDSNMMGCLKWQSGIMFINLALIDTEDWVENYDLFIHEMAHASVHNNDHLSHKFYNTVSELGAKLVQLAIERPDLFKEQKGAAVGK
jgi:hypothetical protein